MNVRKASIAVVAVALATTAIAAPANALGSPDPTAFQPTFRMTETVSGYTATGTPSCGSAARCDLVVVAWNNDHPVSTTLATGSNAWPSWWAPGATYMVEARSRATASNGKQDLSQKVYGNHTRPIATVPLRLTAPAAGEQYYPNRAYTFRGTATPGASITARDGSETLFTTTVGADGTWSATRDWGSTRTYVIDITQYPVGGSPETISGFVWAPIDTQH